MVYPTGLLVKRSAMVMYCTVLYTSFLPSNRVATVTKEYGFTVRYGTFPSATAYRNDSSYLRSLTRVIDYTVPEV